MEKTGRQRQQGDFELEKKMHAVSELAKDHRQSEDLDVTIAHSM